MQTLRNALNPRRLVLIIANGTIHIFGVAFVFVLSAAWLLPPQARNQLSEAYQMGAFGAVPFEALLHLGLSTACWALLYLGFRLCTRIPQSNPPRLVQARGSVYLETLIVLPVLLFMIFGFLQLIILNSAGLLSTLASYNATRVVAVWGPEAEVGRSGVTQELVAEKARVAAAAAVAPVAPADHFFQRCGSDGDTLDNFLNGLKMDQLTVSLAGANIAIAHGHTNYRAFTTNPTNVVRPRLSVPIAFDSTDFSTRGQRKMEFAYCATTVAWRSASGEEGPCVGPQCDDISPPDANDDQAGATIAYQQQMIFPMVQRAFGSRDTVASRRSFFNSIERSHTFHAQMNPNPTPPGGIFGTILDLITSIPDVVSRDRLRSDGEAGEWSDTDRAPADL